MKLFLIITIILLSIQANSQDQSKTQPVYQTLKKDCDLQLLASKRLMIEREDSLTFLRSDSGYIKIKNEDFETKLQYRDQKYNFSDTKYRKDSVLFKLFRNDLLTLDKLLNVLFMDRRSVSQFGDTLDFTLSHKRDDIEIYDLTIIPVTKFYKAKVLLFDVRFIQTTSPYSIFHFELSLNLKGRGKLIKKFMKGRKAELYCLTYRGFEI